MLAVKLVIAIVAFVFIMRIGMWILGGMARANPCPTTASCGRSTCATAARSAWPR